MEIPAFWKGNIKDVENAVNTVQKGKVSVICKSAGKRNVYFVEYGKKNDLKRTANYSSATGARSTKYYADKSGVNYIPTVLLVGGTHGNEWEGVVAINNLISIIETGVDLEGKRHNDIIKAMECVNLLLIPCLNPDGRARIPLETMAGQSFDMFRYYSQGTWKDGSLCNWPECKSIHPIKDACDFMGGYFNDDGVNIMHDNFFFPMAEETKAILHIADEYVPDMTILLHGGDNTKQCFFPVDYIPGCIRNQICELSRDILEETKRAGLNPEHFIDSNMRSRLDELPVATFSLQSALTNICGEPCVTYESNQGLNAQNQYSMEEIYLHHLVLFKTVFKFAKKRNLIKMNR